MALPPQAPGGKRLRPSAMPPSPTNPSRVLRSAWVSPRLGIGLQAATNINSHLNLRGTGNIFKYSDTFTTNGFSANASLNLASAGASLDYYPFHAGLRLSPGVLFYNGNQLSASTSVNPGQSFTLNHQTFYSGDPSTEPGATPITGNATLGLNTNKPAFTITTGWGNAIPRKGGHLSFPFELGVAVTGSPSVQVNLSGWACEEQASGGTGNLRPSGVRSNDVQLVCANLSDTTNPVSSDVQTNLQAQVAKWKTDLDPLKVYPIISFGVSYAFRSARANRIRKQGKAPHPLRRFRRNGWEESTRGAIPLTTRPAPPASPARLHRSVPGPCRRLQRCPACRRPRRPPVWPPRPPAFRPGCA